MKFYTRIVTTLFVGTFFFFGMGGCSHLKGQKKDQSLIPEQFAADLESGKTLLIGDYTSIGNYHTVEVRGVGLVKDLPGTGADDINSAERRMVYDELIKLGIRDARALLADPSTAVVNIVGYLRPGIQEGDLFDVELVLPVESEGKSLRGGWLMKAPLQEMQQIGDTIAGNKPLAYIEGPILVDDPLATETVNPTGLKKGRILSGARSKMSRQIFLNMKSGHDSPFITARIAKEINNRFYISTGQKKGMATAKSDTLIVLDVHPSYRNDVARYLQVVRSIAYFENPNRQAKRIERLKQELLVPGKSQNAAFQLEALGKAGIEPLRSALTSRNTEVLFHAGTSLAHLGDGSAVRMLANIAKEEPAFRVYSLNALSVLRNDIESEICLQELLHVPSAETRYGAFRALCYRNPYDRTVRGEVLQNNEGAQFSYHGISSNAPSLVHITKSRKPEIVLFGNDIHLKQPFALNAGPIMFVNGQGREGVVITKFGRLDQKRTVGNKLDEIIRAIVELGGTYPDVLQMICEAERDKVLTCRLEVDCLPEPNRVYRRPGGNDSDDDLEDIEPKKRSAWQRMNPKTWFEENPGGKTSDDYEPTNTSGRE